MQQNTQIFPDSRNDAERLDSEKRRYLIAGPSWIGDMVMAQSLLITLKQRYPGCLIDVLAPAWSLPVIKRMPEVDEAISSDISHGEFSFFKRRRYGKRLRSKNYTHAIIIPRSWKSALIPYFANIPVRTGYRGEMRYGLLTDVRVLNKDLLKQTVQRYVSHAYDRDPARAPEIPFPKLIIDEENQKRLLKKFGLTEDKPIACMMPGAEYGPAKQWPIEHYAALAGSLINKGWQVWILGSDKDRAAGDEIADKNQNGVFNLCGKTELVDTIDLLACARTAITNDSGLMHVAAATGIEVNVIYGSSTPDYTPPLTVEEKKNIFYLGLECSPCFERVCPLGHTHCLHHIDQDEVLDKIT